MMESKFTPNSLLPLQKSEFTGSDDAELTSLTIGQYFKNVVDNYGDNPAIIVKHQDVSWTYQQYWYEVERVACGLLANGVEPGDRVGIWSPNNIEWSIVQMATARIGAIMVCHVIPCTFLLLLYGVLSQGRMTLRGIPRMNLMLSKLSCPIPFQSSDKAVREYKVCLCV